jgi:hypothetical protein
MRRDAGFFGDRELELIYIAKRLKEAQGLESVLDECEVDYYVEPDTYRGGIIFLTQRVGAFFYVLPEQFERTRALLARKGYRAQPRPTAPPVPPEYSD